MHYAVRRALTVLMVSAFAIVFLPCGSLAGTTGSVSGRVFDAADNQPLANANVTVSAPSETTSAVTDNAGAFAFVSLSPDTYVVTVMKTGYDTTTQRGVTVLADQNQSISIALNKTVATLGKIVVRGTADLVKPGTTSDVYSINASAQASASALGGPGNLNSAYSAMVAVPGVNMPQAQQGWYQTVFIRGGDQDQVGWEFDGIPVNRSYDNAPMTFLSTLGQQELQVYTGGTLATSDASSISGYVNQVIRKGSFPGFADVTLGIGSPTFYNKASLEFGGGTPDQRFTYYVGSLAADSGYRYIDQGNGAGAAGYFYPLACCGTLSGIWDGGPTATFTAAPGQSYAISTTRDRESIGNLHYSIPHKDGVLKDDIQLLGLVSEIWTYYNSSVQDLGGPAIVFGSTDGGFPIPWQDGVVYTGPVFQPPNPADQAIYFFPSSPVHSAFAGAATETIGAPCNLFIVPECTAIPTQTRDVNDNGVGIYKLQYQHNISSREYVRVFGYNIYSNWYINGPLSAFLPFGAEVGDYENIFHQHGLTAQYANQLSDQHLLTISAFYNHGHSERYSTTGAFPPCTIDCSSSSGQASFITNLIDSAGNCYDSAGLADTCFSTANRGNFAGIGAGPMPYPAVGPALAAGAQWIVTSNGYHANVNKVDQTFTAAAINDDWHPSAAVTVNIGARIENYRVAFPDLSAAYPAREFWFAAYNREFCFGSGLLAPTNRGFTAGVLNSCPAGTAPVALTNPTGGGSFSHSVFQPRGGITWQVGADDVLRASAGIFARPASTREASWNTAEQNLPVLLGADFLQYGFTTPEHDVRPDRSTNFDFSWEHHFTGSSVSFKLTPFYRSTQDQLQQLIVNPLTGLFASFNAGHQISDGVEFALSAGDFSRNGFAGKFAFTFTRSRVQYENFANGRNVIDNLNTFIQTYNGYTSACAGSTSLQCTATGIASPKAAPCFSTSGAPLLVCAPGDIGNPYFMNAPQPLLDRNGWYSTYDLIPAPFAAANGYETPEVGSLILNYRRDKWSFTPSVVYSSGAKYGSPVVWPGYDPSACTGTVSGTTANTSTCSANIFIPDVYTGKFDNLGDFQEPWRITANMQIGYEATPAVKYTLTLTNLVDQCHQRGYAWDYRDICVYSALPSSILPPVGNFANPATAPADLRFPYAVWLNNSNTGFVGTTLPFQGAFEVNVKL